MEISRFYNKIKLLNGYVFLSWQEASETTVDKLTYKSQDLPNESFFNILKKFNTSFLAICELPPDMAQRVSVNGISLTWSTEAGRLILSASIEANLEIPTRNTCITIQSPPLKEDSNNKSNQLLAQTVLDIYELFRECNSYIDGERANKNLFSAS